MSLLQIIFLSLSLSLFFPKKKVIFQITCSITSLTVDITLKGGKGAI